MQKIKDIYYSPSETITAGTTVTLLTYNVPPQVNLILTKFSNYVADQSAWGNLTWKVCINCIAIFPLDNILDAIRIDLRELTDKITLHGGQQLTITCTNADTANDYDAGVSIQGDLVIP